MWTWCAASCHISIRALKAGREVSEGQSWRVHDLGPTIGRVGIRLASRSQLRMEHDPTSVVQIWADTPALL